MSDNDDKRSDDSLPSGRLDVPTLKTLAQRAITHSLINEWEFDPSSLSPRMLRLSLDADSYPTNVTNVRIDVRWFTSGDYSFHYLEEYEETTDPYQCRWDRHPKTSAPRMHFHPPPNAGSAESGSLESHHLAVLFSVLDWVSERVQHLHTD